MRLFRHRSNGASRLIRALALVATGAVVTAACSTGGANTEPSTVTVPPTTSASVTSTVDSSTTPVQTSPEETTSEVAAPQVRVSAIPAFGSTEIAPNEPVSITAFHGSLTAVTMTGDDGSIINGDIDDVTWTSTDRLTYGVTYTIEGEATDEAGVTQPFDGTLATVSPKAAEIGDAGQSLNPGADTLMPAYIQIPDGGTVGIAAPIIVTFAADVTDRAAAESALHVTVTDEDGNPLDVEGSWGWMQDEQIQADGPKQSRVHYRPKEYWPARAQVHVEANLAGVDYGSGWGSRDIVRDFTIGENMIVQAEVDTHRLLVIVDDEIVRNYPVSYGVPSEQDPGRTTVSGIHIVQEKKPGEFEMCNRKYNYCGSKQYWGVRINNNGEFIHVNKETEAAGLLGKANVSHGCINMGMEDGEEFFHMVYYGVPVDVEGTGVEMGYGDYIWDWAVSWEEWTSFSAL